MVKEDDLAGLVQKWPTEWMTSLEEVGDSATEEEELDTLHDGEASGKDKEQEWEEEQEEEEYHEEEHHNEERHEEEPQGGEDTPKQTEKAETEKSTTEKRKMQSGASPSSKKKHKAYKSKDTLSLVLIDGDLDEIGENVQEVIV